MKSLSVVAIAMICILYACNNDKLNGKIEIRDNYAYIVNTSNKKAYQFTVKKVQLLADKPVSYLTETIILPPGGEQKMSLVRPTQESAAFNYSEAIKQGYKPIDVANHAASQIPDSYIKTSVDTETYLIPVKELPSFLSDFPNAEINDTLRTEKGTPMDKKINFIRDTYQVTGELEVTPTSKREK
jgi:hypothetical protein